MKLHENFSKLLGRVSDFKKNNQDTEMTLEELRAKLDFTQYEMSLVIGSSEASYHHWENLFRVPSPKYRRAMADLFGVNILHSNMKATQKGG